ncbi:MAG: PA2778 family cysteine peptidase [Bdellovibrionales bacterium]|nr:PA2778 family cysteine peptidase [Bdellovibrionales bacterium]
MKPLLTAQLRLLAVLVIAVFQFGCASSTVQVDRVLSSEGRRQLEVPPAFEILNVPFIEQEVGHCGPATLTMSMQAVGVAADLSKITSQVYTPEMKGSLQADLIGASRRNEMLALPIENLDSLLREVAAGNPVIVFENLALSWLPQWHYALVYGYDLDREEVIMHSGPEKAKRWDLRKFERSWKLADYWGLVVLPPHRLSATAGELAHLTAASMLEKQGLAESSYLAYQAILKRWPESLGALVGIGNYHFSKGDIAASIASLTRAVELHPQSATAKHNLATAQKMRKAK